MQHSTVFAAVLQDLWEHAWHLKQEKRRPDYLMAQSRNEKPRVAAFLRRSSDQFFGGARSSRPVI